MLENLICRRQESIPWAKKAPLGLSKMQGKVRHEEHVAFVRRVDGLKVPGGEGGQGPFVCPLLREASPRLRSSLGRSDDD